MSYLTQRAREARRARAINVVLLIGSVLGLALIFQVTPDLLEYGGYLQRALVQIGTGIQSVSLVWSIRNLIRD